MSPPEKREGNSLVLPERIEQVVLLIRGQRVMLDRDLAALYGVETKNLNKAVERNIGRFPADFMFQLTADEADALRFQFGTLKRGQHFKYQPAFDPLNKERRFLPLRFDRSSPSRIS